MSISPESMAVGESHVWSGAASAQPIPPGLTTLAWAVLVTSLVAIIARPSLPSSLRRVARSW